MIKVTCTVKCYDANGGTENDRETTMLVESREGDTSQYWAYITVGGLRWLVDARDLQDACRNIQTAGPI